ncbi:MAG: transmembrane 220 family protein [Bacteroidia bacterium]|nr:transmembrane 220 family protein [Bacteroidia bacterium]
MKPIRIVFTVIFALFAWFQLNDPDWIYWTALYVVLAVVASGTGFGKDPKIAFTTLLFCVAGLLRYLPGFIQFLTNKDGIGFAEGMQNDYPYIEEAREFGGMVLSTLMTWVITRQKPVD